jgi:hypothetical protein
MLAQFEIPAVWNSSGAWDLLGLAASVDSNYLAWLSDGADNLQSVSCTYDDLAPILHFRRDKEDYTET